MSERLRAEFEKYLARFGLKPRRLPSRQVREAGKRSVIRIKYEEAKERGDPMPENILIDYEKNRERYLAETRHPAAIQIENIATELEATIRAIPAFGENFHDDVFVGEFPTGSLNCETVPGRWRISDTGQFRESHDVAAGCNFPVAWQRGRSEKSREPRGRQRSRQGFGRVCQILRSVLWAQAACWGHPRHGSQRDDRGRREVCSGARIWSHTRRSLGQIQCRVGQGRVKARHHGG